MTAWCRTRSVVICLVCEPVRAQRPPAWFLAGPVGHLSADHWQPASYRYRLCLVELTRAADQRPGRPAFLLAGGRSQPDLLDERMSAGCPGGGVTTGSERRRLVPRRAGPRQRGVRGWQAAGTGRSRHRTDMRNAITAACFVKLTGSAPAGSHLQGLRSPEGDVGMVEGDQPAPPPVLPAGASPGSAVLPATMRLPPAARVTSTRRAWVFGDAGMVTCRTPSA